MLVCLGTIGVFMLPTSSPRSPQDPLNVSLVFLNVLIGILLPWICIVISLGQKKRAGSCLMKVGQTRQQQEQQQSVVLGCLMLAAVASLSTIQSIQIIQQPWFGYSFLDASTIYLPFVIWSLALYNWLKGTDKLELRQNAISFALLTLRWRQITSYHWVYGKEISLILRFQPRFLFFTGCWVLPIPTSKQEAVARLLAERLPDKAESPEGESYDAEQ